jgi:prefoldin subunit 5
MAYNESKVEKFEKTFKNLSEIAAALNTASDHLTRTISTLDEALKKLNVGLAVWVSFRFRGDDEKGLYDEDQIGYCKVNGVWGIALRRIWGDQGADWHRSDGPWLFKDASRELRVDSVDAIPKVVEALAKEAFNTAKKIQGRTDEVLSLAEIITQATQDAKGQPPTLERIAAGEKTLAGRLKNVSVGGLPVRDAKEGSK